MSRLIMNFSNHSARHMRSCISFRFAFACLGLVNFCGLDAGHHLFLGDEMIDAFQQTEQALHVPAPFVEHIIRVARLREAHDAGGPVDLGMDRLRSHQLADVLLRLVLCKVEELC